MVSLGQHRVDHRISDRESRKFDSVLGKIAKISYVIFIFFVFINTSAFQERSHDVEELSTANPMNQLVFGSLLIISLIVLYSQKAETINFIKREKYFFIFLLWCLLTVFWSQHPFVSFKRFILYLSTCTVPLAVLLYSRNSDWLLKFFHYFLGIYLLISIAAVFTLPMAREDFGAWLGMASSKNELGQICIIALIIFCVNFFKIETLRGKSLTIFLICIALTLLVGSKSSTALFTGFILVGIWATFYIGKLFEPIGASKAVSVIAIFFMLILFFSIVFFALDFIGSFLGGAGEDLTLTGRTDLWVDIWNETEKHLLHGAGFRGFWVIDSPRLAKLYEIYIWLPIQAHNGYLDIVNEVGIIGGLIFLMVLISFFNNLSKSKSSTVWKWIIVAAIFINITESKFISPKTVMSVMFIFSYFAILTDVLKSEKPGSLMGTDNFHSKNKNYLMKN